MPIVHYWLLPGRIIYVHWSGQLTLDDLTAANHRTKTLLESGEAPIHLIRDDSQLRPGTTPFSINQLVTAVNAIRNPVMGWAITIGKSAGHVTIATDLYCKVMRIRHHRAVCVEDALQFLQQVDPSLRIDQIDRNVLQQYQQT
jgi:hypothetical protein